MSQKVEKNNKPKVTNYDIIEHKLYYDDGRTNWEADYYFEPQRKMFKIYNVIKGDLSLLEQSTIIGELLAYYYFIPSISFKEVSKKEPLEYFYLYINGRQMSHLNLLTYYITCLPEVENEPILFAKERLAFKEIMNHLDLLGKVPLTIRFCGSIYNFILFSADMMTILDSYDEFPEGISICYTRKIRFFNHVFSLLPNSEEESKEKI